MATRSHPKMMFVIRDDDLSYFTTSQQIDKIYSDIWDEIPISLSVIPVIKTIKKERQIPKRLRGGNKLYPIYKNSDLVMHLKQLLKDRKIAILQHGYTHESHNGFPEFCINDLDLLRRKTVEGKKILETIFNQPITCFVPPHNSISKEGCQAVIEQFPVLCRSISFKRLFLTVPKNRTNLSTLIKFFVRNPIVFKSPMVPRIVKMNTHIELIQSALLATDLVTPTTLSDLKNEFMRCYKRRDLFYLTVHWWDFFEDDGEFKDWFFDIFNDFIRWVLSFDDVQFATLDEVAKMILSKKGK